MILDNITDFVTNTGDYAGAMSDWSLFKEDHCKAY